MSTTTHTRTAAALNQDEYLTLVKRFPPRPIHNERQYDATVEVMNQLAVRDEGTLSEAEEDYLLALTRFVEDYDREHYLPERRKHPRGQPLRMLKFLMGEAGMSTADLGRLLGNSGLASQVLLGRRELSKTHVRKLADHFRVAADLFI